MLKLGNTTKYYSIKLYIYLLIGIIMLFSIFTIAFVNWRTQENSEMKDLEIDYHLSIINYSGKITKEIYLLEKNLHKQTYHKYLDHKVLIGPHTNISTIKTSFFFIEKYTKKIVTLQNTYRHNRFQKTTERINNQLQQIVMTKKEIILLEHNPKALNQEIKLIQSFQVSMEQLHTLHDMAHKALVKKVLGKYQDDQQNLYLYTFLLLVFGSFIVHKILLSINKIITLREQEQRNLKEKQQEIILLNSQLEQRVQEELMKSRQKDHILIRQSRMAALGEMIGHIAHQWRQPLNALNLLLANIQQAYLFKELNDEYLDETMIKGKQYIKKMTTTIDDFRNFFRPDKEKEKFSLSHIVDNTLSLVESTLDYYNIHVKLQKDENIKITGFPNEYSQVIINLLSNSKDAIVENNIENGEIKIEISNDEDQAIVKLLDNGGGIPENVIEKVFDPYFSTKDDGKGSGIGLYMSKMIIEDHMKGRINARNVNGGVEFSIIIPKI